MTLSVILLPGVVLGAVYEYTGNLVVPWLLQSTHDSILLGALLYADDAGGTAQLVALGAVV